jgi:hypothetical protein
VSPILVRPVREQLEHDRIVRLLHTKSRRRYEASMNPGNEQNVPVKLSVGPMYPDVLLFSQDRGRRLQAIVEVETGESVNHLEALAQWARFGKLRVPFHLYVPANMVDVARRLCEDNQIHVNEVWSYHLVGDQFRFTLMHRSREVATPPRPARRPDTTGGVRRKLVARAAKSARSAKSARAAKPALKARPQKRR